MRRLRQASNPSSKQLLVIIISIIVALTSVNLFLLTPTNSFHGSGTNNDNGQQQQHQEPSMSVMSSFQDSSRDERVRRGDSSSLPEGIPVAAAVVVADPISSSSPKYHLPNENAFGIHILPTTPMSSSNSKKKRSSSDPATKGVSMTNINTAPNQNINKPSGAKSSKNMNTSSRTTAATTTISDQAPKSTSGIPITHTSSLIRTKGNIVRNKNTNTNNNKNNQNTPPPAPPDASIIVQLTGELGNHLSGIAQAFGLKMALERDHGIHANLVLNRTQTTKEMYPYIWTKPRDEIQKCFPNLRDLNFEHGREPEAVLRAQQQKKWLSPNQINKLRRINRHLGIGNKQEMLQEGLEYYVQLLADPTRPSVPSNATIALPFLSSTTLSSTFVLDRYYDEIRDLFKFDDQACCAMVPDPDESVFHFRNFVTEVGRRGVNLYGEFQESSPNQTASQLFGHLQPGEKVAITSRYLNDLTLDYVRALEHRGLQGRVISNNQTGLEDFCFLKRAQKEMVGSSMSTFARWAAILGNAQRVQLYVTDAPGMWMKKKRKFSKPISSILLDDNFTWTNPKVLSRIQLPIIPVGADDNVRL